MGRNTPQRAAGAGPRRSLGGLLLLLLTVVSTILPLVLTPVDAGTFPYATCAGYSAVAPGRYSEGALGLSGYNSPSNGGGTAGLISTGLTGVDTLVGSFTISIWIARGMNTASSLAYHQLTTARQCAFGHGTNVGTDSNGYFQLCWGTGANADRMQAAYSDLNSATQRIITSGSASADLNTWTLWTFTVSCSTMPSHVDSWLHAMVWC
jgi:hypothetical protein